MQYSRRIRILAMIFGDFGAAGRITPTALVTAGRISDWHDPTGRQCHITAPVDLRLVLQQTRGSQKIALVQSEFILPPGSDLFCLAGTVLRPDPAFAFLYEGFARKWSLRRRE